MANDSTRQAQADAAEAQRQDLLDRIEELEQRLAGTQAERDKAVAAERHLTERIHGTASGGGLLRALQEAQAERDQAVASGNTVGCIWCGKDVGRRDDLTIAAKLREHLLACEKNPTLHENRRLQAEMGAKRWHHVRLGEVDQQLGDLEHRRLRIANENLDLRAKQKELLVALGTASAIASTLQTRLEQAEKEAGAARATVSAMEHKLWTAVGGPTEPNEDVMQRVLDELGANYQCSFDRLRTIVDETFGLQACGSNEQLLDSLEKHLLEERAQRHTLNLALGEAVEAMRIWGSWEDGVPSASEAGEYGRVGKAYDEACKLTGREPGMAKRKSGAEPAAAPKFQVGQRIEQLGEIKQGFGTIADVVTTAAGFAYRTNQWTDGKERVLTEDQIQERDIPF